MILPYGLRLLSICAAVFFLVHLTASLLAASMAARAVRLAERLRPSAAARLLLALRLAPACAGLLAVALCIPSYLWLEQQSTAEEVGFLCLVSAALGCALWSHAASRGLAAAVRSFRLTRRQRTQGRELEPRLDIVDSPARIFALSGILRPRIVVSRAVMRALSPEQFAAAVRHERAHLASHDNLKRLLLLAAPAMPPGLGGFRALDHQWMRFAEFAADDGAVAGDPRRSLSLASALVRVARLGRGIAPPALSTCFIAPGCDLAERVDRLLHAAPPVPRRRPNLALPACAVGALGAVSLLLGQPALRGIHTLIESLVR